jgi:hypothetical protein
LQQNCRVQPPSPHSPHRSTMQKRGHNRCRNALSAPLGNLDVKAQSSLSVLMALVGRTVDTPIYLDPSYNSSHQLSPLISHPSMCPHRPLLLLTEPPEPHLQRSEGAFRKAHSRSLLIAGVHVSIWRHRGSTRSDCSMQCMRA